MERKYIFILIVLVALALICLIGLRKAIRKTVQKEKYEAEEPEEILSLLNTRVLKAPTSIIDKYASQHEKSCTRFLIPGVAYKADQYLSVFLDDRHYEYICTNGKWELLGYTLPKD